MFYFIFTMGYLDFADSVFYFEDDSLHKVNHPLYPVLKPPTAVRLYQWSKDFFQILLKAHGTIYDSRKRLAAAYVFQ